MAAATKVMTMTSPSQYGSLEKLIGQGPVTVILVYSPSCPHCHTYMPIWKELQKTPNKQANMVTMEASIFDQTPLSEKKQIEGVPSVLKVGPDGEITEVSDIRNKTNMKNILQSGAASVTEGLDSETLLELASSPKREESAPVVPASVSVPSVVPGVTMETNPLPVIPGVTSSEAGSSPQLGGRRRKSRRRKQSRRVTQHGGSPWAAFLASAGPAAVLAGAYAALPARSSGLPPPSHSAKWRRIRARLTRRHRK